MNNVILNEDGEKISSVNLDVYPEFNLPFIIFDVLKKKEKPPKIRVTSSVEMLKEIDFILYAKPISKEEAWAKKQKYILYLRPAESPIEDDWKKLIKLPSNHFLEIDIANYKIRLMGPFVKESEWLNY